MERVNLLRPYRSFVDLLMDGDAIHPIDDLAAKEWIEGQETNDARLLSIRVLDGITYVPFSHVSGEFTVAWRS